MTVLNFRRWLTAQIEHKCKVWCSETPWKCAWKSNNKEKCKTTFEKLQLVAKKEAGHPLVTMAFTSRWQLASCDSQYRKTDTRDILGKISSIEYYWVPNTFKLSRVIVLNIDKPLSWVDNTSISFIDTGNCTLCSALDMEWVSFCNQGGKQGWFYNIIIVYFQLLLVHQKFNWILYSSYYAPRL